MKPHKVRLIPTGQAFIPGIPAVEQEVDQDTADALLAYQPPAFIVAPPEQGPSGVKPSREAHEESD